MSDDNEYILPSFDDDEEEESLEDLPDEFDDEVETKKQPLKKVDVVDLKSGEDYLGTESRIKVVVKRLNFFSPEMKALQSFLHKESHSDIKFTAYELMKNKLSIYTELVGDYNDEIPDRQKKLMKLIEELVSKYKSEINDLKTRINSEVKMWRDNADYWKKQFVDNKAELKEVRDAWDTWMKDKVDSSATSNLEKMQSQMLQLVDKATQLKNAESTTKHDSEMSDLQNFKQELVSEFEELKIKTNEEEIKKQESLNAKDVYNCPIDNCERTFEKVFSLREHLKSKDEDHKWSKKKAQAFIQKLAKF